MTNEIISRSDAMSLGLVRYFTGKPCRNGHIAERQTVNATCFKCSSSTRRAGHIKHNVERNAKRMARYNANKDAEKASMLEAYRKRMADDPDCNRKYYEKFREKRKAESLVWAKNNPVKRRAQHIKRKAAKRNAVPAWYGELDQLASEEAADLCSLRKSSTGFEWHVDHMIPLQAKEACGLHVGINLQVIPAVMNMQKKNKMRLTEPGEWLR